MIIIFLATFFSPRFGRIFGTAPLTERDIIQIYSFIGLRIYDFLCHLDARTPAQLIRGDSETYSCAPNKILILGCGAKLWRQTPKRLADCFHFITNMPFLSLPLSSSLAAVLCVARVIPSLPISMQTKRKRSTRHHLLRISHRPTEHCVPVSEL